MMYLALCYDHRLVDGREAVTFLVRVKEAARGPGAADPRPLSRFSRTIRRMVKFNLCHRIIFSEAEDHFSE